jgi:hypothetical protein
LDFQLFLESIRETRNGKMCIDSFLVRYRHRFRPLKTKCFQRVHFSFV